MFDALSVSFANPTREIPVEKLTVLPASQEAPLIINNSKIHQNYTLTYQQRGTLFYLINL